VSAFVAEFRFDEWWVTPAVMWRHRVGGSWPKTGTEKRKAVMRKFHTIERSAVAGLVLGITSLGAPAGAAVRNVPANYATIQAAVNAASSGDEIQIAAGVYTEQVVIQNKNLTVTGAPGAVLRAWPGMTLSPQYAWYNLVEVTSANVLVQNLTFEGEHLDEALPLSHYGFAALFYGYASGQVQDCVIQGFRGSNILFSGGGNGFVNWNPVGLGGGVVNLQLLRNSFTDNAVSIWLAGDWIDNPGLLRTTFVVEQNTINGIGPTSLDTQLGIEITCGAGGVIRSNRISDHYHLGGNWQNQSYGIVAFDAYRYWSQLPMFPVQVVRYEGNALVNNQQAIGAALANNSQFVRNFIQGPGGDLSGDGLLLTGTNVLAGTNRLENLAKGIELIGGGPDWGNRIGIARNVTLAANRFCQVTNLVTVEPFVTNVTDQGTLTCPFPPLTLGIAPGVLLSWLDDGETHTLESAPSLQGPWSAVSVALVLQDGQITAAVRTDSDHRFFRLN
jgi:hypothetical protein